MTRDDALEATREASVAAGQVSAHLERLAGRLGDLFPLAPQELAAWEDDPRERLHAFLRLFEQLYDLTSRRLMRGLLLLSGEDPASLSALNVFRRIEALTADFSSHASLAVGATRNRLVHEYPISAELQARNGNDARRDLPALLSNVRAIVRALQSEGFIDE